MSQNNYIQKSFQQFQQQDANKNLGVNIQLAENLLKDCFDVLISVDLRPLLIFGSLLGCYRENGLINHDLDMDIGVIGKDEMVKIKDAIDSGKFSKKGIMAIPKRCFSLVRDGFYIDIYPFLQEGDHYVSQLGYPHYKLHQEDFPLQTIDFLDRKFYTIKDIEKYLIKRYGKNWTTPIANKGAKG